MPVTPMQREAVLRFLHMMMEKRLEKEGLTIKSRLSVALTHPDGKLSWYNYSGGVWLGISEIGSAYQLVIQPQDQDPDITPLTWVFLITRTNSQRAAVPTIDDWEKITLWVQTGTLVTEPKILSQTEQTPQPNP